MEEILRWLRDVGSATTSEVAEFLGISRQAALYKLKTLERRGLVKRIGGSPGRGKNAVWIPVLVREYDPVPVSVGMGLAWINEKEESGGWSFLGRRRDPFTTALASIPNAEVLGRRIKIPYSPQIVHRELGEDVLSLHSELEYYSIYLRALYLQKDERFNQLVGKLDSLLLEASTSSNEGEEFFLWLSGALYYTYPYRHLLRHEAKAVDILLKDITELNLKNRPILGLAWAGVTLLMRGHVKRARRITEGLLLRAVRTEEEIYLEDRPPLYLERLFGLKKESLLPTTLLYFLLRRLGMRESKKALRHVLKHQQPSGGFSPSPLIEPDVPRTAVVIDLLWNSLV